MTHGGDSCQAHGTDKRSVKALFFYFFISRSPAENDRLRGRKRAVCAAFFLFSDIGYIVN